MASDTLTPPGSAGAGTKPACDVSDIDAGDHFRLVLRVATTLDRAGQKAEGTVFWLRAQPLGDYARALTIAREFVEVIA